MTWVWVALGGAFGAVVRDLAARRRGAVPGTDLVNRAGAVLLGIVVAAADGGAVGSTALAFLGIGLAGGMTTFSTWMAQITEGANPGPRASGTTGARPDWTRLARETLLGLLLAALALAATAALVA